MAHLPVIGYHASTGLLREVYEQMMNRPMPPTYVPPHDDAAGIIRAHSLDPEMMRRAFRLSGTLNGQGPLPWPQRELVNAVTSRLNQCFY
jgi:alkylhydroperoxidase family enzyme